MFSRCCGLWSECVCTSVFSPQPLPGLAPCLTVEFPSSGVGEGRRVKLLPPPGLGLSAEVGLSQFLSLYLLERFARNF